MSHHMTSMCIFLRQDRILWHSLGQASSSEMQKGADLVCMGVVKATYNKLKKSDAKLFCNLTSPLQIWNKFGAIFDTSAAYFLAVDFGASHGSK